MNKLGLRDAIVMSLLASLLECIYASNGTNGYVVYEVRGPEQFSQSGLIGMLNHFIPGNQRSNNVARVLAKTKNKEETVLGNRSVKELLELNWYSGECSIEDLARRKIIVEQSNFESVQGAMARYFLNEYCRDVYSAVESRCNEKLELWAFKLEPGEDETLEGFFEMSLLLQLARRKVAIEAFSDAIDKSGGPAICKKVVGRVETIRSQGIKLVIEKDENERLLGECARYL
jgi:hypothetical protein